MSGRILVAADISLTTSRFVPGDDRDSVLTRAALARLPQPANRYIWMEAGPENRADRVPEMVTALELGYMVDYAQRSALVRNDKQVASYELGDALSNWTKGKEAALIIVPHDDDPAIGMGLMLAKLVEAGVPIRVVVVSDGRNGYTRHEHKETIVADRRAETESSFARYGVKPEDIIWLGFPDTALTFYQGRRTPLPGEVCPVSPSGFTGLEDALVTQLRKPIALPGSDTSITATRVFTVNGLDLHQDHVAVVNALKISLFHAMGGIWPENGAKPGHLPYLYEFPVYCPFGADAPPNIMLLGHDEAFEKKLAAIADFATQEQIAKLVESVRENGPREFLREVAFKLYDPGAEYRRFA